MCSAASRGAVTYLATDIILAGTDVTQNTDERYCAGIKKTVLPSAYTETRAEKTMYLVKIEI